MEVKIVTEQDLYNMLEKANLRAEDLPKKVIAEFTAKKLKLATAESCTGGLISKLITDLTGASTVFDCGVCSYANDIKERVLGVKKETLENFGAVSAECAKEMAEGVRLLAKSFVGISTTGVAGPTGGTDEKPVGLVYIGISTNAKTDIIRAEFMSKNGNRDKNRQLAATLALYCVLLSI